MSNLMIRFSQLLVLALFGSNWAVAQDSKGILLDAMLRHRVIGGRDQFVNKDSDLPVILGSIERGNDELRKFVLKTIKTGAGDYSEVCEEFVDHLDPTQFDSFWATCVASPYLFPRNFTFEDSLQIDDPFERAMSAAFCKRLVRDAEFRHFATNIFVRTGLGSLDGPSNFDVDGTFVAINMQFLDEGISKLDEFVNKKAAFENKNDNFPHLYLRFLIGWLVVADLTGFEIPADAVGLHENSKKAQQFYESWRKYYEKYHLRLIWQKKTGRFRPNLILAKFLWCHQMLVAVFELRLYMALGLFIRGWPIIEVFDAPLPPAPSLSAPIFSIDTFDLITRVGRLSKFDLDVPNIE